MKEAERRIRDELLDPIGKWTEELMDEGHGVLGTTEILATVLLWGAAGVTANGVESQKGRVMRQRLNLEGPTQAEENARDARHQGILDKLWPIVRDELRALWPNQGGEE